MQETFIKVLLSVFSLALLAVPGFIVGKLRLLPENAGKTLTSVLLYIGQPLLSFMSFQKCEYSDSVVGDLLVVAGVSAIVHAAMLGLVFGLFFKKAKKDEKLRVLSFTSVFGNCGFMGLPLLQMLFGDSSPRALMYGAVVIAVFNLFCWTFGIFLITRDAKYVSVKKAVLNPPFIALCISLPLFLILKKPINLIGDEGSFLRGLFEKLFVTGNFLGDLVTPLSMIILGLRLSEMKFRSVFLCPHAYVTSAFKLLVMPLLTVGVCALLRVSQQITYALFFLFAMPSATMSLLFCEQYGGDREVAGATVLLTTVLSVLTIPLTYLAVSALGV